jgi:small subunit ribosomal protein S11e
MLVWDSKLQRKQLVDNTLTPSAHSLEVSPSEEDCSSRGLLYFRGLVISTKMRNTIIIRRNFLHYITKYNRFEKRHRNIAAHISPCFRVKEGDIVTVGQCRPLSKTVSFNVLKVTPNEIFGSAKKQFVLF